MKKTTLYSAALVAAFSFTNTTFAQNTQTMPMHGQIHKQMQQQIQQQMQQQMQQQQAMKHPAFKAPVAQQRPVFDEFPTPEELARMTPPEPVTEDKIRQRFAKQKARVEKIIAQDRKRAEKYAKDFARFQKHQADQLAKIMAKAEQQREIMFNNISKREQQVLETFRQRKQHTN